MNLNEAMNKVRDYIALIMTVAVIALVGLKIPIVDRFWDVYLMIISFFFGSKQANGDSIKIPGIPVNSTQISTEPKP